MNTAPTPDPHPAGRRPRWLTARLLTASAVSLLLVLATGLGAAPAPPITPLASTRPLTPPAGAPALNPATAALRCAGRPVGRAGSDRASATGFQLDIVMVDQPSNNRRRGQLLVSCARTGRVEILACPTRYRDRANPTSYRDRDLDTGLDDLDPRDWGLDTLDPRDWGLDPRDLLDGTDPRDLRDLINQRTPTSSSHTPRLAGLEINLDGLANLRHHHGRGTSDTHDSDPFDLYPDNRGRDDTNNPDDHSRGTGACRWVARR